MHAEGESDMGGLAKCRMLCRVVSLTEMIYAVAEGQ